MTCCQKFLIALCCVDDDSATIQQDVDAGGGTNFPDLGITVMPKKGRALLWPSIYDSAPMSDDNRMRHQALPVEKGTKFAANGW
jgi:prolyl 4-hydroxylase